MKIFKFQISNFKFQISKKGFTVAEMIIVTLIIAILTTIGFRTYKTERERFQFNQALIKVMQMINSARNSAITNRAVGTGIIPPSGYGVYINLKPATETTPHFTLFASLGTGALKKKYDSSNDLILETYRLPRSVAFEYLLYYDENFNDPVTKKLKPQWNKADTQNPVPSKTEAVLLFRPPLAETYLGDNNASPADLEELGMRYYNTNAVPGSPKKCQYVKINRVKSFPTLEYTNCSEYDTGLNY